MKQVKSPQYLKISIETFAPQKGINEHHAILRISNLILTFEQQVDALVEACQQLTQTLGAKPLFRRYFTSDVANQTDFIHHHDKRLEPCPISLLQQPPADGSKVAIWVYFLAIADIHLLSPNFLEATHNGYRHLWITDLRENQGDVGEQTEFLFQHYNDILSANHCTLTLNCIRTWLFVREIDLRYGRVVNARTAFFNTHGLTDDTHYIASTGIEGRTSETSSFITMDAIAVAGLKETQIKFLHAPHYLNRTSEYGVTFERGTAITYGDRRHIYISGTASIDHKGDVIHSGLILPQARRTLQNIEALLKEANATLTDIKQAIVYIRDTADYTVVERFLHEETPLHNYLIVIAPVCRPAWLIEIECIAITADSNPDFPNL
ncbi:MAG: hypothetical protein LBU03_06635 [Tannerellaceae bacterium]|jgi:enamine deaminase RidA (YjgF/YER057c/UK114 family)|nr:hypothetical protein [Tannerellaceae bacterium]